MKKPPAIDEGVESGQTPFRGDRAASLLPGTRLSGPMPWVLAIMVMLSVVASAGALALGNTVSSVRSDLEGSALVQIVDADARQLDAKAGTAMAVLRADDAVLQAERVPQARIAELLEPWLGSGDGVDALPLPALIEVTMRRAPSGADYARLQSALETRVPGARIDAQSEWLGPVTRALSTLAFVAVGLVVLLALITSAAVWLAARNALGTHRDTVEIVHLLGANDTQISRIFQRSVLLDAVAGGLAGMVAGAALAIVVARQFAALQSGMVAAGSLSALDWALIGLVPLFAVGIAVYTARMTVLSHLRKTL